MPLRAAAWATLLCWVTLDHGALAQSYDPCLVSVSMPPQAPKRFNLTGLKTGAPYSLKTSAASTFTFNVCRAPTSCGNQSFNFAACETEYGNQFHGFGNPLSMNITRLTQEDVRTINSKFDNPSPPFPPTAVGVKMLFAPVQGGLGNRVTVMVPCDPQPLHGVAAPLQLKPQPFGGGAATPNLGGSTPGDYVFVLPSPAGCEVPDPLSMDFGDESNEDLSSGSIFVITLMCLTVVYCLGGLIWKHQTYGVTGREAIPNIEFWQELPLLMSDGLSFTVNTFKGLLYPDDSEYERVGAQAGEYPGTNYPAPPPAAGVYNGGSSENKNAFAAASYNDL